MQRCVPLRSCGTPAARRLTVSAHPFHTPPRRPSAQSGGESRIWFLRCNCGANYPREAPQISFVSKIIMDAVDARGNVMPTKVPYLQTWNPTKNLHGALTEIQKLIGKAPRAQPAENLNF